MSELRFELVNPSDCYFFTAPDLETAALAVCLLGHGKYGGKSMDGGEDVPIFLFGGHDDWFKEKFGRTFEDSLQYVPYETVADCLDTFRIDGRRTSMNNIGKGAKNLAEVLRAAASKEPRDGR